MKKYLFLMVAMTSSLLYSWQDQEVSDLYKEIPVLINGYQEKDKQAIDNIETIARKCMPEHSNNRPNAPQKSLREKILTARRNATKVVNVGCVLASAAIFIKYAPVRYFCK